ncbi:hypothetical protein ACEPAF_5986 [Sanghuangporus sanghuang]
MLALIKAAPLPEKVPINVTEPHKLGMEIDYLKKLKTMRCSRSSLCARKELKTRCNPSSFILHGWAGTFLDFHKVTKPLVRRPYSNGFHVVVPSILRSFLSTLPRQEGWSTSDTAKVYHGFVTSVLGYEKYAGQGGDWPRPGLGPGHAFLRDAATSNAGSGYLQIQVTKPSTIVYAIASTPLGMLSHIGENIYGWSDPERVDPHDVLDTVALHYLSGSFLTSIIIYTRIKSDLWSIKEHRNGGHFPALDDPAGFIEDVREFFGEHWPRDLNRSKNIRARWFYPHGMR